MHVTCCGLLPDISVCLAWREPQESYRFTTGELEREAEVLLKTSLRALLVGHSSPFIPVSFILLSL
jgi:hypothetical protein